MSYPLSRQLRRLASAVFLSTAATGMEANAQVGYIGIDPPATEFSNSSRFFGFGAPARSPIGYVEWCVRKPLNCVDDNHDTQFNAVVLTSAKQAELKRVNLDWNRKIKPLSDLENYGVEEYWAISANGYGDCEDYVLGKRRDLIRLGWPRGALLITVVTDHTGEGHAVLTVRTDRGYMVLDNYRDEILFWSETGHKFLTVQNPNFPSQWLSVRTNPAGEEWMSMVFAPVTTQPIQPGILTSGSFGLRRTLHP